MTNTRSEIRAQLKARLLNRTDAGSRISTSRARAIWRDGLPAIVIYTSRQDWTVQTEGPREYAVHCQLTVELYVNETVGGPADDEIDALMQRVRDLIAIDRSLGIDGVDVIPISDEADFTEKAQKKLGAATMSFDAFYIEAAPEGELGELGNFEKLHTEAELPPIVGERDGVTDQTLPVV